MKSAWKMCAYGGLTGVGIEETKNISIQRTNLGWNSLKQYALTPG